MSVATLGLAVDSSQAVSATKALDGLAAAAKPAAQAAADLSKASSAGAVALSAHTNATNVNSKAHAGLSTQAMAAQHSIRSMVEMVAMGIPPTQALTSQMNHLTYAASGPGGLKGAFTDAIGVFRSFLSPTTLVIGGLAAITAGAAFAVNSVAKLAMQFEDSARIAGASVAQLQAFAAAASFKGINNSDFLTSMDKFAASVYDAKNGMGGLGDVLRANHQRAGTLVQDFGSISDLIKSATGNTQLQFSILSQAGLPATMQWVRFLSQGKDAIAAQTAEFMKNGDQMDALAAKAKAFQEAWDKAITNLKFGFQSAVLSISGFFDTLGDKVTSLLMKLPKVGASIPTNILRNAMNDNAAGYSTGSELTSSSPTDQFYSGLGKNAPGNATPAASGAVDPNVLQRQIQLEQQHIALLGQTATAADAVHSVELQVAQARLSGVSITQKQVDVLKTLAYENALGITQIKSQTDSYNTEAATIGMAVGAATRYTAIQNAINEAKRQGKLLTDGDVAAITAQADALGKAAQAASEKFAQDKANFDLQTAGLSGVELQIAQLQKQLHGNDWKDFMNDGLAATTRLADSMKQLADAERSMFTDFLSGMRQGKTAMESLTAAAGSFANKLADMGANKIFDAFKSGDISKAFSNTTQSAQDLALKNERAAANSSNTFSFNGMSAGNTAVAGLGAAAAGVGIYGQAQQAGAAGGSVGGGALSGAMSGAMAGFALAGPVGGVIGGIGGAIMGLFGASNGARQAAQQAQADWAAMKKTAEATSKVWAGGGEGSLQSSITQATSQLEQYVSVAQKAKDTDAIGKLRGDYDKYIIRMAGAFQTAFGGVIDALNSGLGQDSPFATAAANVKSVGDSLKGFVEDAKLAFAQSPVDYVNGKGSSSQGQDTAVAQATAAAQKYLLSLLGQAPVLTEVQAAIQHLNGTAAQLGATLVDLGMSSTDAAAAIQDGVLASMRQLADTFANGIQREINAATGADYKNSLADLVAKFQANMADAAALGLGPDLVNKWFKVSAQKIVNDAGLAGDAIADLIRQFPQLTGVVTASLSALTAIYNDASAGVDTARQALTASYEAESSALQSTIDKTNSYVASLKEMSNSIKIGQYSPLSPQQQYLAAQAQARQDATLAQGGDADAQARLQGDLSTYLDQSKNFNASTEAYYRDFQEVQDILAKSEAAGSRQVSVAQQQLDAIKAQVSGLVTINDSVISVVAAIQALQAALLSQQQAAATLAPAAAASNSIDALYQSVLGRAPDAAGAAYWQSQIAGGMTGNDLLRSFVSGAVGAGQRGDVDPRLLAQYGLQNGGIVGNGIFGIDSVLASFAGGGNIALAGGEYVMPTAQTQMYRPQLEAMRSGRAPSNDNGDWKSIARALRQGNSADTDRLVAKFDEFIDVLSEAPAKNKEAFRQLIGASTPRVAAGGRK